MPSLTMLSPAATRPAELVRRLALLMGGSTKTAATWNLMLDRGETVRVDRLHRATRWDLETFAESATEAERSGWIRLVPAEHDGRPDRVGIERFGASLFGLTAGRRRPPGPSAFAGMPGADVLAALATWQASAVPAVDLASELGREIEAAWDDLGTLEALGLVERWPDHPVSPTVGLATLPASKLGLRLSGDGSAWLGPGESDPTGRLTVRGWAPTIADDEDGSAWLDEVPDNDAIEGGATLEAVELCGRIAANLAAARTTEAYASAEAEARELAALDDFAMRRRRPTPIIPSDVDGVIADRVATLRAKLPRVLTLHGLGVSWPVMMEVEGNPRRWSPSLAPCPGCGGGTLGRVAYCTICHRSGLDDLLPPADLLEPSPPIDEAERWGRRMPPVRIRATRRRVGI